MNMLDRYQSTGKKATRDGFGAGMHVLGQTNEKVVALCADLIGSVKIQNFINENPERFFQVGIAEANMMGIAAGLATAGKIPFTSTFANFSTGRVYDQIRQSIAYSNKNVKVCASHAGLTLGEDGATHQILEDIGLTPSHFLSTEQKFLPTKPMEPVTRTLFMISLFLGSFMAIRMIDSWVSLPL